MANKSDSKKQIGKFFIVGCSRSGTTLLQSLLASHPEIISFPESKFFVDLVWMPEERSRRYALGLVTRQLRPTLKNFLQEVGNPELEKKLPILPFVRSYVRAFEEILETLTRLEDKTIWLEKTPEHLHRLKYIEKYMPEAKFIHIIRNGTDVIASIYDLAQRYPNHWGRTYKTLDLCIQRWLEDIEISRQYLSQSNHLLVRYESLVADAAVEVKRLCQFIEVDFDGQIIENYRATSSKLIRTREAWKSGTQQSIQSTNAQKFLRVFTPEQQQYVRRAVANVNLESLVSDVTSELFATQP